jgi:serpin B
LALSFWTTYGKRFPSAPSSSAQTYEEVNEEGTEAAAATGAGIRPMALRRQPPPFRFIVDRPFVAAIGETRGGLLLFLGAILDPRG